MVMMRCLDAKEANFWKSSSRMPFVFEYRGEIDPKALEEAVTFLAAKYPALRATVRESTTCGHGYMFDVDSKRQAEFVALEGDRNTVVEHRRQTVKERLAGNWPANLFALVLIRGHDGGHIIFELHHALFMFAQIHGYTSELFHAYTEILAGRNIAHVEPQPFPISNEEFLSTKFIGTKEISSAPETETSALDPKNSTFTPTPKKFDRIRIVRFNHEETASIIKAARNNHVKVQNLITSAMVMAIRKCQGSDEISPIYVRTALDSTRRSGIEWMTTTDGLIRAAVKLNVPIDATAETVAKDLQFRVNDLQPTSESCYKEVDEDIWLNNGGRFPDFAHTKDFEIVDFLHFEGVLDDLNQMPETKRKSSNMPKSMVSTLTFAGKLKIACFYREDMDDSIIEDFENRASKFASKKYKPTETLSETS